jgi:putative membrane protein
MEQFLIRLGINGIALWTAARWIDGIHFSENPWEIGFTALVFASINAVIRPVVKLLSLPFIVLSLGLFTLVINALMLLLTSKLTGFLVIDTFGSAIKGGLVVSLVSWIVSSLIKEKQA